MNDIRIKDEKMEKKIQSSIIVLMLFSTLVVISMSLPPSSVSAQSIDSRVEPAIVLGSDVPGLVGTPVGNIWVYAFTGGLWEQIPFQVDERNDTSGLYFDNAVDNIFDGNDELVFMPFDAGDTAPATSWVKGTDPTRFEVAITDPLDSSSKYVYIFTSSNLVKTFTDDYVSYNATQAVIKATDYSVGFDDVKIGIMDEIRINTSIGGDNMDILDRIKYRFQVTIMGFPFLFDEDDFDYTLTGYKDGPVRVIQQIGSGDLIAMNYAYRSYAIATQTINMPTSPDWVRVSLDFLSTSIPMTYYDSNSNTLTINGIPDSPTTTPAPSWVELSSSHGTVVSPRDFSQVGGSPVLYYTDDLSSGDAPESEFGQYGNSGIYMANPPTGNPTTSISFYMLPPNQGNVGSTYVTYTDNPVTISALSQQVDSTPPPAISDVTVIPDPQEVNGFANISAFIDDNYKVYGAWVNVIDPDDNPAGNFSMSYDSTTGRYYLYRAYDMVGTYTFTILANDTANNWNSSSGQYVMQDTTLPTFSDPMALPNPQEIHGYVDISAIITDNHNVSGAWVAITNPNSDPLGNYTMSYASGPGRYYYNRSYDLLGSYQFTIWAMDESGNWNFTSGQFVIQDLILPTIDDVTAVPDPQEANEKVNISILALDISGISGAWVCIMDPDGTEIGNFSMHLDSVTQRHYYETACGILGTYHFTIWVADESGNWNQSSGQFAIHDTTPPEISDIMADPNLQEINGTVDISAKIEDNLQLAEVWINITHPNGDSIGNFPMELNPDTSRYNHSRAYDAVGSYGFTIWARDSSGNWNFSSGQFGIQDTTPPNISDITIHPDPQVLGDLANISVLVTDSVVVDSVRIKISDPDGDPVGNFSMKLDPITQRYYYQRAYNTLGVYQFTIWAKDSSDNWGSGYGSFLVHDLQPPTAHASFDQAVYVGTTVTLDGSASSDNVGIVNYTWTFTDGSLRTLHGQKPDYRFDNVGNFRVSLNVTDEAGNWDTDTMWVNVTEIPDTTSPAITHAPPASAAAGKPLKISAEITDNEEVTYAGLFYRQSGETDYTEVAMIKSGNEWTAQIPTSAVTMEGLEYYIFATDGVNNATAPGEDYYSIDVKGEEKGGAGFPWLLLIILMVVVILVAVLFFMLKKRKERTKDG